MARLTVGAVSSTCPVKCLGSDEVGGCNPDPETIGGGCKVAINGLDPGIPAGMTTEWMLPCVLIRSVGKIVILDVPCLLVNEKYI
jgi:hypothetical protein